MRICIHRGANEIGGTCVELESQGKRIVLDVGVPLDCVDPDTCQLPPVGGFADPDESLLGVVLSHPHLDHYGLAYRLPEKTTFLIGKAAQAILSAAKLFSPGGVVLENTIPLDHGKPIPLGPFTITPFLIDHSAYDSYAVLVEADGKKLFYSGDFRAHGRKSRMVEKLIASPPLNVDVLLMEGTCVGREDQTFPTEEQLVEPMTELFSKIEGMPLVWCSGQNIDRIVTMFKACRKAKRILILDMYTAEILRATGNNNLPQAEWDGIKVYLPRSQKHRIVNERAFEISNFYKRFRIHENQLAAAASTAVMLFRPSMGAELEEARCLKGSALVYSLWAGYLKDPRNRGFNDWLQKHSISVHQCHTSGHASVTDLQRMREAFASAIVVPVHLTEREQFQQLFRNVQLRADGEWWEL